MAYNYYDNFSVGASNHDFQANNKFYQQEIIRHSGRDYNNHIEPTKTVLMRNKKNMLIREQQPVSMVGSGYYQNNDQPLMAMMVVESSPSSPSSNSQEGGRGYSGINSKQRLHSKKHNVTDRSRSYSKADNASGEDKNMTRSIKKRVSGMAGPATIRSAADEEYLTTKKVEIKRTKNTERHVQRQVVLEDGRVLNVGGPPHVVVDTIEDIETHETNHVEDQNIIDELKAVMEKSYGEIEKRNAQGKIHDNSNKNTANKSSHGGHILPKDEIISDTFQRTVNTHDVKENVVKTHMAQDIGLITRRGVERLLRGDVDPDRLIEEAEQRKNMSSMELYKNQRPRSSARTNPHRGEEQRQHERHMREKYSSDLIVPYKRDRMPVAKHKVYEANSNRKVVDTEDVHNISRRNRDGKITSETVRTEKHEVYDDKEAPDDGSSYEEEDTDNRSKNFLERDEEKYRYTKTDKFTDYYKMAKENSQGIGNGYPQRSLKLVRHGPHVTTEDREFTVPRRSREKLLQEEENIKHRKAAMKKKLKASTNLNNGVVTPGRGGGADSERTDALTQKPLNFHNEEKTRRKETDIWLDRHFGGSEWSLSQGSYGKSNQNGLSHSRSRFYRHHQVNEHENVDTSAGEDFNAKVRRAQSFNCIPTSYNNPGGVSRVVKHTTTTYRPGMEGKVVYSSITKNVEPPSDNPKMRAYHSASNLNTRNPNTDGGHFPSFSGITNSLSHHQHTLKANSTTSLFNGIVKEHSPLQIRKKDTSVVREIPIMTLNKSHANILDEQPHRPPRKTKNGHALMKSTGDLYDNSFKEETDPNYYENRRSYYFGTSADNLDTGTSYGSRNHALPEGRGKNYYPEQEKRKSRKDQLIMDSSTSKSYDRVQSAPDAARQYRHATNNMYDPRPHGGESTTTGFESTVGLLGVTYKKSDLQASSATNKEKKQRQEEPLVEHQIPIREEVYHDSPRPERKAKRLVPTVEGRKVSKKEHDRVVYRSESTRRPVNREPLYRRELPRNKLYPSPHKEDRRKNVNPFLLSDDNSKMQMPPYIKEFSGEESNTASRNKREHHNYYHHHQSSSSQKKSNYSYDHGIDSNNKEPFQFSKSFHDLSLGGPNNMYDQHIFHTNLDENRTGVSVDNNLDLILPPKDYLGYRATERSDGYRTLGAPGTERGRRLDGSKSFAFQESYIPTSKRGAAMHKKRSKSFLVHSGNMSSDEKSGAINLPTAEYTTPQKNVRQRHTGYSHHSRKLYGEDPSQKYAEDFHKNKRHTYHFPDVDSTDQFNHCEDLTFTKHLSRENISNGNLNKSSNENLLDDYMQSSYLEAVRNSHQRSSSSPPDAYEKQLGSGKTEHQVIRNKKNEKMKGYRNDQIHYSTIDHTKSGYLKSNGNENTINRNVTNENFASNNLSNTEHNILFNAPDVTNECSFLHIEREIPMQSASLEAQKFKTIIFLSGQ